MNEIDPVSNFEKHQSKNPIVKLLLKNYFNTLRQQLALTEPEVRQTLTEIGCGEGIVTQAIHDLKMFTTIRACDILPDRIRIAQKRHAAPEITYYVKDLFTLDHTDAADVTVCLQVLEHVEHVEEALCRLQRITRHYCLVSVPNEPIWSLLNMVRGKYILRGGNTPGHIHHWNPRNFRDVIAQYFDVVHIATPLPWIMVLGKRETR